MPPLRSNDEDSDAEYIHLRGPVEARNDTEIEDEEAQLLPRSEELDHEDPPNPTVRKRHHRPTGFWACFYGPDPPRIQSIKPWFPKIQQFPANAVDRWMPSRKRKLVALAALFFLWLAILGTVLGVTQLPRKAPGGEYILQLECTDTLWRAKNGCGLDGIDCRPFDKDSFSFRCPAKCADVQVLNPHPVGPVDINYRPFVIGGGEDRIYRGDSFICSSAIHAGVVSDVRGGCGRLSRKGQRDVFPSTKSNGLESISFDSYFPLTFQLDALQGGSCPADQRQLLLVVSLVFTAVLSVCTASPRALFFTVFIMIFAHVSLVSDPPSASRRSLSVLPDHISMFAKRLLPALFCAVVLYRTVVRRTLSGVEAHVEKTLLWLGGFWFGALSNYTFDWIPISRLTAHDLNQQPGAKLALAIILLILIFIIPRQVHGFWVEGRLPRYLALYALFLLAIAFSLAIPGLQLRIHHYILALLLLPGTSMQTRASLLYQGILLGLFVNGIARWDFDSVLQTADALRADGAFGSSKPNITAYIPSPLPPDAASWTASFTWAASTAHDGISALVNDVERFRAFFEDGDGPQVFNWTRESALEVPEYVHASGPEQAFTFNHGNLKTNETSSIPVDNDSIFRIASVSKNLAVFSALVVENKSKHHPNLTEFSLDAPVRHFLPSFRLPDEDWEDGGRDITLRMLASHSAGLSRESYSTDFNLVLNTGKADAETIGAAWAAATPEGVIESVKKTRLMFAPGERAAYSNVGISILASAVVSHYNEITGSDSSWSQFAMDEIFSSLDMTHSFFGVIPDGLRPYIGVPGGPNWADLVVGLGYDPAAGMWSSSNDLSKYLYSVWLSPSPSKLITRAQRRRSLKPNFALPDGKQLVGPGWEIDLKTIDTTSKSSSILSEKTYASFGKAGDGGGWHAWIDVIPNLGYGIVVLSQHSGLEDYVRIVPTSIRDTVHDILIPAFAKALASRLCMRFSGRYADGRDSGIFTDTVRGSDINDTTFARLEVVDHILYLRELVVNGTSALEGLDRLGWTEKDQSRFWSTPEGVVLTPAEGAAENAQFGRGAQVWRMMIPGLEVCDWFDFDGYSDQNGWPLSKVVLVEREGGQVELHYPPYDIVLTRSSG
ncbi:beta-lactamase/transpeptidase-like protein [Aaosphaeria arxii CBS 175.79]|uniref:Beta-lactamase/transpeptidase-like protein n=1 Tax=Aaosphaeria arxii CBS 175.79 TaxID=1450172 RepID=A0A6A5Y2J0_9PLEO|nr:beta-lactamase/transpeptidase-like protein [Aaosphaeria arxii CBS 175.79]KAF2019443.1 beta-lactamase/transpeptidase-like protein [Aaosphaeria arxii CBS 175.79]